MILIVCVDDKMGMAFNRRRQSRDRAVCENMIELAEGKPIRMDERSAKLFEDLNCALYTGADFAEGAEPGELCFVELQPVTALAEKAEKIILYRWNRRYPADLYFDIPLEHWQQTELTEFAGSSHEIITREVYVRES